MNIDPAWPELAVRQRNVIVWVQAPSAEDRAPPQNAAPSSSFRTIRVPGLQCDHPRQVEEFRSELRVRSVRAFSSRCEGGDPHGAPNTALRSTSRPADTGA